MQPHVWLTVNMLVLPFILQGEKGELGVKVSVFPEGQEDWEGDLGGANGGIEQCGLSMMKGSILTTSWA